MSGMITAMSETNTDQGRKDVLPIDLDKEVEDWNWARAAGVSASQLREAFMAQQRGAEAA